MSPSSLWLFYNRKSMLFVVYCIRGANLQPVAGTSCDPYVRVKLGKDTETGTIKRRPSSRTSTRPLSSERRYRVRPSSKFN